jgi:hypothetical protein
MVDDHVRQRVRTPHAARPVALVGLAFVALVILWAGRDITFLEDDWFFIDTRLGGTLDTYLQPHNEHLLLVPVALYKALFVTVGISHYWPYRVMVIVAHLACVVLLFLVARRSIGSRPALFVPLPFLFIGPAWHVVLFPFNVQWCLSIAALLGLLLLLERRDTRSEIACSLLVVVALASSSLGVPIAAGVIVAVLWHPDRWRRAWIPAGPLALYGVWFLAYNLHPNYQGPRQFPPSARYVFDAAAGAMGGLLGLPTGGETSGRLHRWFVVTVDLLTAVGALVLVWLVAIRRRVSARLAMLLVTLLSNWVLLAITRSFVSPSSSRYIYGGAFLIVLVALELARGAPIGRRAVPVLAVVACAAGALNLVWLLHDAGPRRKDAIQLAAQLGAVEVSRDFVSPSFPPRFWPALPPILAARYFHAIDTLHGSPGSSPREIAASPEYARVAADEVLLRAARVGLTPYVGPTPRFAHREVAGDRRLDRAAGCVSVAPNGPGPSGVELTLPTEGMVIGTGPGVDAEARLRRFADTFPKAPVGTVGRLPQLLSVPRGRASTPWQVQIRPRGAFKLLVDGHREVIENSAGRVEVCQRTADRRRFVSLMPFAGRQALVAHNQVGGYVESGGLRGGLLSLRGWSASSQGGPAEVVVVFADGRFVAAARPSTPRQDVAESLGPAARASGFEILAPLDQGESQATAPRIRVFGIIGHRASEIPRLKSR